VIKVWISNKNVTDRVVPASLLINQSLRLGSSNCTFQLTLESDYRPWPKLGQIIEVWHYADPGDADVERGSDNDGDFIVEFAGPLQRSRMEWVSPPKLFSLTLTATDWKKFFDRRFVTDITDSLKVKDILEYVLDNYASSETVSGYKFTLGSDIDPDLEVTKRPEIDQEPSGVIEQLASQLGYTWYIDYTMRLIFEPKLSLKSPLPFNVYFLDRVREETKTGRFVLEEDIADLRNRLFTSKTFIKAPTQTTQRWDTRGWFFSFATPPYPLGVADRDLLPSFMEVYRKDRYTGEWKKCTLLYDEIDGTSGDLQGGWSTVYVNFDRNFLRLPDLYPLVEGEELEATYYPYIEMRELHPRPDSIRILSYLESRVNPRTGEPETSPGYYEYKLEAPEAGLFSEKGEGIAAWAQSYLDKFAFPILRGSFTSRLPGWRPGQHFNLRSYIFREWGGELEEKVHIQNVRKRALGSGEFIYDVSFESWRWKGDWRWKT